MENPIVTPAPDPSLADLRAMISGTTPADEAKTETSETAKPEEGEAAKPETDTETVEEKPEPKESDEEPLPEGVQKRIAKEAEKAARIQSEIDRAVSDRKAREAELQKLKADEKGSEPVKTPKSSTDSRPKRPQLGEKGHESETYDQFLTREEKYDNEDLPSWIETETIRKVEEKQTRASAQKASQEKWDAAVKEHGTEFPAQVESVRAVAPEELQIHISRLDNWSGVAVHLAKHPAQLSDLAKTFEQNPTKAIATLGRIEAALTPKESKPATTGKPLPEPLKKVGGSASASGEDLQTTLEKGSYSSFKATVAKLRKS